MALVLEDGTGLSTATAYIDVAFLKAFAEVEGLTLFPHNDTKLDFAIQRATRYLDTRFTFVGYRKLTTQRLEWPRSGAYYRDGRTADNVPLEVQEACAFYAQRSLDARLTPDPTYDDSGARVLRKVERVGPITQDVQFGYGGQQPTFRAYPEADRRLKELVINGKRLMRA